MDSGLFCDALCSVIILEFSTNWRASQVEEINSSSVKLMCEAKNQRTYSRYSSSSVLPQIVDQLSSVYVLCASALINPKLYIIIPAVFDYILLFAMS
jgi:hypothetical protein